MSIKKVMATAIGIVIELDFEIEDESWNLFSVFDHLDEKELPVQASDVPGNSDNCPPSLPRHDRSPRVRDTRAYGGHKPRAWTVKTPKVTRELILIIKWVTSSKDTQTDRRGRAAFPRRWGTGLRPPTLHPCSFHLGSLPLDRRRLHVHDARSRESQGSIRAMSQLQ